MAGIYTEVRAAIRRSALSVLSEFTNPIVIFSNSNGTEPAESYVVVNILNIEQQGHHSTSTLANTDETLTFQVAYEVTVQFSFVGSLSGDMSQSFTQNINNNPLTRLELQRNKLGLMRKSQIRRARSAKLVNVARIRGIAKLAVAIAVVWSVITTETTSSKSDIGIVILCYVAFATDK